MACHYSWHIFFAFSWCVGDLNDWILLNKKHLHYLYICFNSYCRCDLPSLPLRASSIQFHYLCLLVASFFFSNLDPFSILALAALHLNNWISLDGSSLLLLDFSDFRCQFRPIQSNYPPPSLKEYIYIHPYSFAYDLSIFQTHYILW